MCVQLCYSIRVREHYQITYTHMTFQARYKGSLVQSNNIDDVLGLCKEYDDGQGRKYDILDEEIYD